MYLYEKNKSEIKLILFLLTSEYDALAKVISKHPERQETLK